MQVLNTYVQNEANGFVVLTVFMFLAAVLTFLLKDDITRFLEHHTIGARFYSLMKHVWLVMFAVFTILTFVCFTKSTEQHIYVEATVIDSYPIGALYDKYEISEKRGDIWVLEQRTTWQEDVDSSSKEE